MCPAADRPPFFVGGGFQVITAMVKAEDRIAEAFRTGVGMFWGGHHHDLVDGTVMIVEPMAAEGVEGNLNPVGRVLPGASVMCCTPNAIASGQTALGTLATEAQLLKVALQAGFRRFRRSGGTPFNHVFEVRP